MSEMKIRTRQTGATASLLQSGPAHVTSVTGGHLDIVTAPSQEGFSPLDLLFASLAGCLVLSAKMAASQMGVIDRLTEVTANVTGTKADGDVSRIETFHIDLTVRGNFDEDMSRQIAEAAEHEICTVSNTLRGHPGFKVTLSK